MSYSVQMPALGESVTEGTVTRWLKRVGDRVEVDEPLLEVSTDKVDTEIPSPFAGTVEQILVDEDETVEIGTRLAVIAGDDAGQPSDEGSPVETTDGDREHDEGPNQGVDQGYDQSYGQGWTDGAPSPYQEQPRDPFAPAEDLFAPAPGGHSPGAGQVEPSSAPPATGGYGGSPWTTDPYAEVRDDPATTEWAAPEPAPAEQGEALAPEPTEAPAPGPASEPAPAEGSGDTAPDGSASGGRVQMPALGESVAEGTVTRWLKRVGDRVEVDEPLLEVSTDKVDTEIPSPFAGTVEQILVDEDETVVVGAELAVIGNGAGTASDAAAPAEDAASGAGSPAADDREPGTADAPREGASLWSDAAARELDGTPDEEPVPAEAEQPTPTPALQASAGTSTAPAPEPVPVAATAGSTSAPAAAVTERPRSGASDLAGYVTPLVRRMAVEHGISLAEVQGTGVGGRIRKQDVLEAARAKAEAERLRVEQERAAAARTEDTGAARPAGREQELSPLRGTRVRMTRLRKMIAQRMVESLQVSAQLTTVVEADVTRIALLRQRAKADFEAREGVRLSFLPFFALAAVEALKQHPVLNASIDGDEIVYHDAENLSVAVDTERGLVVPVIHGAGDLNIAGLARKIADLAERTRTNRITPDDIAGGTFTLTNTGSRGALFDTPIINQPQVAILGTGMVVRRPAVVTDEYGADSIAVRSLVYLALSYDHRIVDGADAARFLATVKARLEEGAFEADLGL